MLAYAKATAAQLLEIEQSYSLMLRHSLSCDASFPWDVLTGAEEQDGLGAVRLATEVTKARLRHCQAIATSPTAGENVMVLALVRSAQRWAGSRQPANVLSQNQVSLFEPLDSSAPASAHLFWRTQTRLQATYLASTGLTSSRLSVTSRSWIEVRGGSTSQARFLKPGKYSH